MADSLDFLYQCEYEHCFKEDSMKFVKYEEKITSLQVFFIIPHRYVTARAHSQTHEHSYAHCHIYIYKQ